MPQRFNACAVCGDPSNTLMTNGLETDDLTLLPMFMAARRYASNSLEMENGPKGRCWVQLNFIHMSYADVECSPHQLINKALGWGWGTDVWFLVSSCVISSNISLTKTCFKQESELHMKKAGMTVSKKKHLHSSWCTFLLQLLLYFEISVSITVLFFYKTEI